MFTDFSYTEKPALCTLQGEPNHERLRETSISIPRGAQNSRTHTPEYKFMHEAKLQKDHHYRNTYPPATTAEEDPVSTEGWPSCAELRLRSILAALSHQLVLSLSGSVAEFQQIKRSFRMISFIRSPELASWKPTR